MKNQQWFLYSKRKRNYYKIYKGAFMYQYFVVTITLAVMSSVLFAHFLDKKSMSKKHKIMAVVLCTMSVALFSSLFPIISGLVLNITTRINEILHINLWTGFSFTVIFIAYLGGILIISVYLSTIVIAVDYKEGEDKAGAAWSLIHKLFSWIVGPILKPAVNEATPMENNCVSNYHAAVLQGAVEVGQNILQKPVDSQKNIDTIGIGTNDINGESFDVDQEVSLEDAMSLEYLIEEDYFAEEEIEEAEIEELEAEEEIAITEEEMETSELDGNESEIVAQEEVIDKIVESEIEEPEAEEEIAITEEEIATSELDSDESEIVAQEEVIEEIVECEIEEPEAEEEIAITEEEVEASELDSNESEIVAQEEVIEEIVESEIEEPEAEEIAITEEEVEASELDSNESEAVVQEEVIEEVVESEIEEPEAEEIAITEEEVETSEVDSNESEENLDNLIDSSLSIHISDETNANTINDALVDNMSEEVNVVDRLIEEAFLLKASGDLEGAITNYMCALEQDIEDQVVFWLVLDICVLYKQLGKSDLAKDILESYVTDYGSIMNEDVKTQIISNL
jgi:hypothetical protein